MQYAHNRTIARIDDLKKRGLLMKEIKVGNSNSKQHKVNLLTKTLTLSEK